MALTRLLKHVTETRLMPAWKEVMGASDGDLQKLLWCLRWSPLRQKSLVKVPTLRVAANTMQACNLLPTSMPKAKQEGIILELDKKCAELKSQLPDPEAVEISSGQGRLFISLDNTVIVKAVIKDILNSSSKFGALDPIQSFAPGDSSSNEVRPVRYGHRVLVEYSSPNIAKPFHAGHLRSTLIGNFIANINEFLGNDVKRINYLGDWGTQFGILGVGFEKYGDPELLKQSPMEHLFDIYVATNKLIEIEKMTGESQTQKNALAFFRKLEEGDITALKFWKKCRQLSIDEFEVVYNKLGVHFDEYEGESMYYDKVDEIIELLQDKQMLHTNGATGIKYAEFMDPYHSHKARVSLLKSDNTTLYFSRDLAAIMERRRKYKFDKIHYVVDESQSDHFRNMFGLLRVVGMSWAEKPLNSFHIRFGRVQGMSSRRGSVVLLKDIIQEAQTRMLEIMQQKETTKVKDPSAMKETAERLGVAAIIVQDMKSKRLKPYEFSWDQILRFSGETGVFLMYTHSRLCSIIENSGINLSQLSMYCEDNAPCKYPLNALREDEAIKLSRHLARFGEAVWDGYNYLEPCAVVHYLFTLGHLSSKAIDVLMVKNEPLEVAVPRLALFHCTRTVLANGLRLLGIEPLDKM